MYPQTHFLFPFFVALLLQKMGFLSWKLALLAGIIGVLVDLDHYAEHILHAKKKKFSVIDTWNNSVKLHKFHQRSFIHHWQGFVIVTLVLVTLAFFNWQLTLAFALGYYSHLLLDYIHLNKAKSWAAKLGYFYLKEPWGEVVLDVVLVVGIIMLLLV